MRRTFALPAFCRLAAICLIVLGALPGGPIQAQSPDVPVGAAVAAQPEAFAPGRLIVGVDPSANAGASTLQAADALAALDAQVINATDPCVADAAAAGAGDSQTAVQSWQVTPGREEEAIALLSSQDGVRFVARDVYMYAAQEEIVEPATADKPNLTAETPYTVNDPLYTGYQWGPQRANFPRAWQLLPSSSALTDIRVTVIDSGVDFDHPDLAGRLLPGKNYLSPDDLPVDDNGHGTHVAGVIAAITNNGQGMAGSAPRALIDPRKVLDADGSGSAINLRYAICDAARDGARVINMSLQFLTPVGSSLYTSIHEAVDFAEARGVLLVAAGGNNRTTHQVYYPALYDEVIAVAALTVDNQRPDYGPISSKVEIAAPGGDDPAPVFSAWPSAVSVRKHCTDLGLPLVQGGSGWYCGEYGTSMASPHVAGVAALVMSVQPALTAAQVRSILAETATDVGLPANEQGAGLLNAEGAVRRVTRSNLQVSLAGADKSVAYNSAPYTATLVISNPSLEPLAVTGLISNNWLSVTGISGPSFARTVVYGQPLAMPVVISPTHLITGTYLGNIQLTATRSDGSVIKSTPTVLVRVGTSSSTLLHLALVMRDAAPPSTGNSVTFSWETPVSPTVYALGDSGSVDVTLPFVFPLSGPAGAATTNYAQARIYADGFVTFPDAATGAISDPGENHCLPWSPGGLQGVFGWWANLDAGAAGAEVSSFRPAANRFVIQYKNLPAVGVTPLYRVTFQIVLYQNGDVQLNYQQAPEPWSPSFDQLLPPATVGVQARNGLYRNQVACAATGGVWLGTLPRGGQSLRIKSTEVY